MNHPQKPPDAKTCIDELTAAFYRTFTNKGGVKPAVQEIYQLFIPNGMIVKSFGPSPEIYTLQQFVEPREKMLQDGSLVDFEEMEVFERTEIFGNIAHRFSLYRKSGSLSGEFFEGQGMKSIQFLNTPDGWKISSLAWDDEREGLTIPERYRLAR